MENYWPENISTETVVKIINNLYSSDKKVDYSESGKLYLEKLKAEYKDEAVEILLDGYVLPDSLVKTLKALYWNLGQECPEWIR